MTKLQRIQEMEAQLQALKAEVEAESKVEKWSPKGGKWFVKLSGRILNEMSTNECREFGAEYQTKKQAEKARDAMRSHNRLLAWLSENDDGWEADWNDYKQVKYYIYLDCGSNKYFTSYNTHNKTLATVYMSKENAIKLCELLNEGVVEL